MTGELYHSAHAQPPAPRRTGRPLPMPEGCEAFEWDLMAGPLPGPYASCDVLYADLPWHTGFAKFNQRAGVADGRTFLDFIVRVVGIVEAATVPCVLVTGKHALRHLPPADTLPIVLNATPALAFIYGKPRGLGQSLVTASDVIRALAGEYGCVGDFCAGYGRAPRLFAQAGKRFVASDINRACVQHIQTHAGAWAA